METKDHHYDKTYETYEEYVRRRFVYASESRSKVTTAPPQMYNTEVLCFVLGWQGGTVHQIAEVLNVTTDAILSADWETMQWLCRLAQCYKDERE
jgi:hypothetical protein